MYVTVVCDKYILFFYAGFHFMAVHLVQYGTGDNEKCQELLQTHLFV